MVVRGGDMRQVTGKREAGGVTTRAPHDKVGMLVGLAGLFAHA